jgi:hypothetical protein
MWSTSRCSSPSRVRGTESGLCHSGASMCFERCDSPILVVTWGWSRVAQPTQAQGRRWVGSKREDDVESKRGEEREVRAGKSRGRWGRAVYLWVGVRRRHEPHGRVGAAHCEEAARPRVGALLLLVELGSVQRRDAFLHLAQVLRAEVL